MKKDLNKNDLSNISGGARIKTTERKSSAVRTREYHDKPSTTRKKRSDAAMKHRNRNRIY